MPQIIAGVVAAISVVAEAAGAAAASLTLGLGGSLAAASVIGEVATVGLPSVIEFGALAGVSALLAPRPHLNVAGSPQQTKYDPQAPIPCVMGRYGVGGNVIYRTTSGGASKAVHGAAGNEFLTEFNILSGLGPIQGIETLRFDDTILHFSGQTCDGGYIESEYVQTYNPGYKFQNPDGSYVNNNFSGHAWQNTQLGAVPSAGFAYPTKIANANDQLTEWTSAMALSGFAASALTISYDVTVYAGGEPQKQWVIDGYLTYDPRLDSTYPGGAGGHRYLGAGASNADLMTARATHAWSDNPAIHALNYALGHFLPDPVTGQARLYAGIGAGITGVDVASFVAAANVADANGWKTCGQWTTGDGKWSVLTAMLQAGGATPINDRGRLSCMVSTPRTSLGTITAADLAGDVTLDTGVSMRERINTVFPRYSSPQHRWQIVQADTPVRAETYVAEDGGVRSKTLTFEYVYTVNQACQLAAYAICDGREIPAITLTGKPHLRNYAVGDCVLLDIPEAGLGGIKAVVTKRSTAIATGGVTLTLRSETDAKHAYSLGISGVAPTTPAISGFDPSIVPAPIPASWAAAEAVLSDPASGATVHVIQIDGTTIDNLYATDVIVEYAAVTSIDGVDADGPFVTQTFDASVTTINLHLAAGRYHVLLRYKISTGAQSETDYLDLGVITVGAGVAADTAKVAGSPAAGVLSDLNGALADILLIDADVAALQAAAPLDFTALDEAVTQAQAAEAAALAAATTLLPSSMATPLLWSAGETIPNTPLPATTPEFLTASDGAQVYRSDAGTADVIVSAGQIAPVVGRTYRLTATGRLNTAPNPGDNPTIFQAGILGAKADGSGLSNVYAPSPDITGTPVGQIIASTVTLNYDGSTPLSAIKSRVLINYDNGGVTPFSAACYDLLALLLEDITESTAAYGFSQSAGQYSDSAGQYEAAAAAQVLIALSHATDANTSAEAASTSAAAADHSSAAAATSAALVANYNPGANLIRNPTWSQGLAYWAQSSGGYFYDDAQNVGGPCVTCAPSSAQTIEDSVYSTYNLPADPGASYSMQVECISGGVSGGTINAGITWHTPGAADQYTVIQPPQNNGNWGRYKLENFKPPVGATGFNLYVQSDNIAFASGAYLAFRKFKLELGAACTPYTDDQTGASILDASNVAASATAAVAVRTTSLEADVPNLQSQITHNETTAANATGAVASDLSTLTADYNGTAATVSNQEVAISDLNGQVTGMLKFTADAGGNITSLEILSSSGGETNVSAVKITAQTFLITTPSGQLLFGVDGSTGDTYLQNLVIAGNLILEGSVTTTQLAAGAATSIFYGLSDATTSIYVPGAAPVYTPPPPGSGGGGAGGGGGRGGPAP